MGNITRLRYYAYADNRRKQIRQKVTSCKDDEWTYTKVSTGP